MTARINKARITVLFVIVAALMLAGCAEEKVPTQITVSKQMYNICFVLHGAAHIQNWYPIVDGKPQYPQVEVPGDCQAIYKTAMVGGDINTKDENGKITLTIKGGQHNTEGNVAP